MKRQKLSTTTKKYSSKKISEDEQQKFGEFWTKIDLKARKTTKVASKTTKVAWNDRSRIINLPRGTHCPLDYLGLILDEEFFNEVVILTNNKARLIVRQEQEDDISNSNNES